MSATRDRQPAPDRARKRAIRALAAELGVAYSVAARLLTARTQAPAPAVPAIPARPSFPIGTDEHRAWMFAAREHRTFNSRVSDTRLATKLPLGRAAHLTTRFPPLRATAGIGPLYHGEGRETALAMLYAVLEHESPNLLPPADELAWAAELGEEAAVDISLAALDRAARHLLDHDRWRLWVRVEAAITAGEATPDRRIRDAAIALGRELRSTSLRSSLDGARHILDALLVEPHGAHPPGTRVRVGERPGTVVGVEWDQTGPPAGYQVRLDDDPDTRQVPLNGLTPDSAPEPARTH
ncbi:hypothetical protein GCM10010435_58670 [Winogradskya consettensis]|uniref:Uncharacterized protein n=1 Tax=Winogradskya consettensis TaxID=113560 RepID=A0A919SKW3_9ACTN|nr:hypothetical protein [Actinoplanes consettensis]GIM74302.1 hypothetical protein Aco04nite_39610 [Actinoplanes consettensis]